MHFLDFERKEFTRRIREKYDLWKRNLGEVSRQNVAVKSFATLWLHLHQFNFSKLLLAPNVSTIFHL